MKRIFKYRLPRDGESITITANVVKWLNIQEQHGWPHIWAVVDDAGYESEYEIVAWGTGWDFPDELNHCRYMGTAQDGAGYVWHYFMQEKSKSWSPAETGEQLNKDYWYWNGSSIQDYTTSIDNLQSVEEYLTAAVASSNTATLRACT